MLSEEDCDFIRYRLLVWLDARYREARPDSDWDIVEALVPLQNGASALTACVHALKRLFARAECQRSLVCKLRVFNAFVDGVPGLRLVLVLKL